MARVAYIQTKTPTWLQTIFDLVASELVAHGAYSLVATVNSPGGMPCNVYKCSGASSPLQRDWYLCMARLTANPTILYFAVAEGFDTTTKNLIRPAPGTNNASTIPASDGSYGGGTSYPIWSGTTGSTLNTADIRWSPCSTGGYVVDGWTVTSNKGLWLWGQSPGRSSSYVYAVYCGWIEPLQAADPGIVVVGDFLNRNVTTDGGSMVTTRHPTITTATAYTWNWCSPSAGVSQWTPATGTMNGAGDRLFNGRPIGGRRLLRTNIQSSVYGDFRGLWPDLLNIATSGGGGTADTVMPGEQTTIYDQANNPSTYIYAYRYGSGGNELWINTSTP